MGTLEGGRHPWTQPIWKQLFWICMIGGGGGDDICIVSHRRENKSVNQFLSPCTFCVLFYSFSSRGCTANTDAHLLPAFHHPPIPSQDGHATLYYLLESIIIIIIIIVWNSCVELCLGGAVTFAPGGFHECGGTVKPFLYPVYCSCRRCRRREYTAFLDSMQAE